MSQAAMHEFEALDRPVQRRRRQHQVQRLQQDHGWLEEDWNELQPQLDARACGVGTLDPASRLEAVTVFSSLYLDHIALEKSLIYPETKRQAEAQAAGEQSRRH